MGQVIDLVARMKRVYERYGKDLPRFKIYHRVGMYHFILDCNATFGVETRVAEFTSKLFKELSVKTPEADSVLIRKMGHAVEEHLKSMKHIGLWFDENSQTWFLRGEHPWDPSMVEDDDDPWYGTNWYERRKISLQERYGKKEGAFLTARIAKLHRQNTDPCKDNERIAVESDIAEMRRYEEQRGHGCCGFSDNKFEFVEYDTGKKKVFWYGFNYGH